VRSIPAISKEGGGCEMSIRTFLRRRIDSVLIGVNLSLALTVTLAMAGAASAQIYPARAIRFITVAAPGTVGDIIPRVVSQELAPRLGQPVVVENRPGGSGLSARPPRAFGTDG
jgi:hypothetical protein